VSNVATACGHYLKAPSASTLAINQDASSGQAVSGWRILTNTTRSGSGWDVKRLKLLTANGEFDSEKCDTTSSGPDKATNAFKDNSEFWSGRVDENSQYFVGLLCPVPDMGIVELKLHQLGIHSASTLAVQRLDTENGWTTVEVLNKVATNQEVSLTNFAKNKKVSHYEACEPGQMPRRQAGCGLMLLTSYFTTKKDWQREKSKVVSDHHETRSERHCDLRHAS